MALWFYDCDYYYYCYEMRTVTPNGMSSPKAAGGLLWESAPVLQPTAQPCQPQAPPPGTSAYEITTVAPEKCLPGGCKSWRKDMLKKKAVSNEGEASTLE